MVRGRNTSKAEVGADLEECQDGDSSSREASAAWHLYASFARAYPRSRMPCFSRGMFKVYSYAVVWVDSSYLRPRRKPLVLESAHLQDFPVMDPLICTAWVGKSSARVDQWVYLGTPYP